MIVDWLYLALYACAAALIVLVGTSAGGFTLWARARIKARAAHARTRARRRAAGRTPHLRAVRIEDRETIESRRIH